MNNNINNKPESGKKVPFYRQPESEQRKMFMRVIEGANEDQLKVVREFERRFSGSTK